MGMCGLGAKEQFSGFEDEAMLVEIVASAQVSPMPADNDIFTVTIP
jgi:hypothetical protein